MTKSFGKGADDIYYKLPILNFEMHKALFDFSHEAKLRLYYQNIQKHLLKEDSFVYHFSLEDLYIYLTAHEYKHYSNGGTGLRSLIDTYVYLNSIANLDFSYIKKELEKLQITEFEEANRRLSLKLFSGDTLTEKEREQLNYYLSSGTYGNITHRISNQLQQHKWNKLNYMLHRFSVPLT